VHFDVVGDLVHRPLDSRNNHARVGGMTHDERTQRIHGIASRPRKCRASSVIAEIRSKPASFGETLLDYFNTSSRCGLLSMLTSLGN
jgi:hypothetical protein